MSEPEDGALPSRGEAATTEVALDRVGFCKGSVEGQNGVSVEYSYKCSVFEDGMVTWELRRHFLALLRGFRESLDTNKIIHRRKLEWIRLFMEFSVDFNNAVIASRRSARCSDGTFLTWLPYIRDEYTITTHALILLYFHYTTEAKQISQRDRAQQLTASWMAQMGVGPLVVNGSSTANPIHARTHTRAKLTLTHHPHTHTHPYHTAPRFATPRAIPRSHAPCFPYDPTPRRAPLHAAISRTWI